METPVIKKEQVKELLNTRFIKVYDLQYAEGKHYFDATRRPLEELVAIKNEAEFKSLIPDAVTCFVILVLPDGEPRILLSHEYRYTAGQYLLSPPAGLIDPEDRGEENPLITAAKREIFEETGLELKEEDRVFEVSRCLFCTPGMTDESNGLVCAVKKVPDLAMLNHEGTVGTELFGDFTLLTGEEAKKILLSGRDREERFYSMATWCALIYFVSGLWKE